MNPIICRKSTDGVVMFVCPGCTDFVRKHPHEHRALGSGESTQVVYHGVWTQAPNQRGAKWGWNGSLESPTFTPSILLHGTKGTDGQILQPRCHSFVTDGKIRFLSDCEHALRGQTVDLPEDPS